VGKDVIFLSIYWCRYPWQFKIFCLFGIYLE